MVVEAQCQAPQQAAGEALAVCLFWEIDGCAQQLLIDELSFLCFCFVAHQQSDCPVILIIYGDFIGAHFVFVHDVDIHSSEFQNFLHHLMGSINYCDNQHRIPLDCPRIQQCLVLILEFLVLSFKDVLRALVGIIFCTKVKHIPSGSPGANFDTKAHNIFLQHLIQITGIITGDGPEYLTFQFFGDGVLLGDIVSGQQDGPGQFIKLIQLITEISILDGGVGQIHYFDIELTQQQNYSCSKPPIIIRILIHCLFQFKLQTCMNQQEIDDLLNDSDGQTSKDVSRSSVKKQTITKTNQPVSQPNYEESNSYANEDFEDYQESKRIQSMQQSQSQSQSTSMPNQTAKNKNNKDRKQHKQLTAIKEQQYPKQEQPKKGSQNYIKPALELRTEPGFNKKNKIAADKVHLPHNYARLEERERQLLLTTLTEQNKRLKAQLLEKDSNYKKLDQKYKMVLQQKVEHSPTAKELALQKQVSNLRTKIIQMSNLNKISEQRQKYKTKISKNPGSFIPEEESSRRESELLELIDKLKRRLLQSDESMGVLQKKINEGVEHNDELHRKMKRVEQMQYKLQKMVEQAETDREYIQILKQKVKDLQKQIQNEKDRYRKQQVQMKRLEMGQLTHTDIIRQLKEVKKQKQLLEKSLKDMSGAMITNVRKNYQQIADNRIEDSGQLLRTNIR